MKPKRAVENDYGAGSKAKARLYEIKSTISWSLNRGRSQLCPCPLSLYLLSLGKRAASRIYARVWIYLKTAAGSLIKTIAPSEIRNFLYRQWFKVPNQTKRCDHPMTDGFTFLPKPHLCLSQMATWTWSQMSPHWSWRRSQARRRPLPHRPLQVLLMRTHDFTECGTRVKTIVGEMKVILIYRKKAKK